MTTTVTIDAHCADDTEVLIQVREGSMVDEVILLDGESGDIVVYDERRIIKIAERPRTIADREPEPEAPKTSKKGNKKNESADANEDGGNAAAE